ncbi:DUF4962 domain-containing protein [Bacteroides sp. 51]|uniref:DUF4962 domain-containing protein n=1 Tax=Bacteroides sp. 51 TaxID=2302938 RepID=UPI0013D0554C|nr:DUF4962 domain-containing protein [Bacteroides sp. 51]NDV82128.1 DUF4962 domain-containing protein [Bacteroides sp. 51]
MKKHLTRWVMLLCIIPLSLLSCSDDDVPNVEDNEGKEQETVDSWHEKIRDKPYPTIDNGLYINPAPLIVPQAMKKGDFIQFSLSKSASFKESETILSAKVPWCFFNPHQVLDAGTWFWRFRSANESGVEGAWSETYQFTVEEETPEFVTPAFDAFISNVPKTYPRLYSFLDDELEAARGKVESHSEFKALTSRANTALNASYSDVANPYDKIEEIRPYMIQLYQAYRLTQKQAYRDKMLEFVRLLQNYPLTDAQIFATNFGATDIALVFIKAYDIAQNELTTAEKQTIEELLIKIGRHYYNIYCGYQENHIFDNHFWQQNMRIFFQIALMLYTKAEYETEATKMLEYYYELWTARAPDSGFNRDGLWRNGVGYFNANVKTLYYMPSLFSSITRHDFLKHPWYQNAGKAITYAWPPNSKSVGFGDSSENGNAPNRLRIAFADFLAREVGDGYAAWYANECQSLLLQDYEFRIYRMVRDKSYTSAGLPAGYPKLIWHKDAGEVTIHSDIAHPENDLSLSFRSSTFASGSHTLADQNSFNILYKGADVYRSSGYYVDFSGAHNLMSYRHSRAHNTILVNGIGQPFSMKGYGNVVRAINGEQISYCLGDASNAYSGISDDPLWVDAFKKAGITQSPENGFGTTPLTKYRRHVFVLHPDIVVLYDELEAKNSVRWDWLLHSPTEFAIHNGSKTMETWNEDKQFKSVARMFSNQSFEISQTNQFVVPPTTIPDPRYPDQWHLTATFSPSSENRILTIIQVLPEYKFPRAITVNGEIYTCGGWNIEASLDCNQPAGIHITNSSTRVAFSYGNTHPVINNNVYLRKDQGSSILYDIIDGEVKILEMNDYQPISTRIR